MRAQRVLNGHTLYCEHSLDMVILFLKSNHGKFVVIQIKLFPTSQKGKREDAQP